MFQQFRHLALAAAIALVAAVPGSAVQIRVSQESVAGLGDFDGNVLGFIDSFDASGQTAAQVYAFSSNSYTGTIVPAVSNSQQTFFVLTSTGLSLFHVIDSVNDGTGGTANLVFEVSEPVALQVVDDAGNPEAVLSGGGTTVTGGWTWTACCTDGVAFGSLDNSYWSVLAQNTTGPTGVTAWTAVGANSSVINLFQDTGRRVRFDVVPEPGAIVLLSGGLLGLAWLRRRRS